MVTRVFYAPYVRPRPRPLSRNWGSPPNFFMSCSHHHQLMRCPMTYGNASMCLLSMSGTNVRQTVPISTQSALLVCWILFPRAT
uniref:Uncharacterized protein n=1 Tax=Timema poppense TaxID=170557 RepID=A0A7R9DU28_TIMPO|nr:unnamed protein product [Timema poppensis]